MTSTPDSGHQTPDAILVSRDLFFASKITGTAAALGFQVGVEGNPATAAIKAAEPTCRCVILDLTLPDLSVSDLLAALPAAHRPAVIAFGPHVDTAASRRGPHGGLRRSLSAKQILCFANVDFNALPREQEDELVRGSRAVSRNA